LAENTFHKLFLTEGISDVTYHYCCLEALYGMLSDGAINLTMSTNRADALHRTKMFYLSTQRSKSLKFGYARNSKNDCRVELDGYRLKTDGYEGMPIDYWGGSMGKQSDIGLNASRISAQYGEFFKPDSEDKRRKVMDMQAPCTNFEFEDRIFSDKPSIPLKYIKRVDCLVNKVTTFEKAILSLASNLGVDIFFYDNERDFILQTENTINKEILMSEGEFEEEKKEPGKLSFIHMISNLLGSLFCFERFYTEEDMEIIKPKVMAILKKFELEEFYEPVIKELPNEMSNAYYDCTKYDDMIRKLNTKFKSKYSNNIMLLAQYVLRSYGVNSFDALQSRIQRKWRGEDKNSNIVQDSVKCVIYSYNWGGDNNPLYLELGDRNFWEWFDKYDFYNEISRQLDDDEWNKQYGETPIITHKSKSNESFKKYLQHIMRNDKLSLYDGSVILSKIYNNNWEKMLDAFGRAVKPVEITKENFFDYESKLGKRGNDMFKVEEKLFRDSKEYWDYKKQKVSQS